MKVYKLEVMVIDEFVKTVEDAKSLFDIRFPNWANVEVVTCREADIGEWSDENPLNYMDKTEEEMNRLFPKEK
jgi:hypothetical protein